MEGYHDDTYGERLVDVYDEWFGGLDDVDTTIGFLDSVAGTRPARFLELAVGTGRLALPLAAVGHHVTGIDVSASMLDRLRHADPAGTVEAVHGDMVDDLPDGPFDVVFVAYNTLFMLADPGRQAACFAAVSAVLPPGGAFVVEAVVPPDAPRSGSHVSVRSMTAERLVLDVTLTDVAAQTVSGQVAELVDGQPVRLRPYVLRWSFPAELDSWAAAAGFELGSRHADADRSPFDETSSFHLSVYRRRA